MAKNEIRNAKLTDEIYGNSRNNRNEISDTENKMTGIDRYRPKSTKFTKSKNSRNRPKSTEIVKE